MIAPGTRIRLTAHGATVWNDNLHPGRFDWRDRRGFVHHLCHHVPEACVIWDGNHTQSRVPLKFLEQEDAPCPAS